MGTRMNLLVPVGNLAACGSKFTKQLGPAKKSPLNRSGVIRLVRLTIIGVMFQSHELLWAQDPQKKVLASIKLTLWQGDKKRSGRFGAENGLGNI